MRGVLCVYFVDGDERICELHVHRQPSLYDVVPASILMAD